MTGRSSRAQGVARGHEKDQDIVTKCNPRRGTVHADSKNHWVAHPPPLITQAQRVTMCTLGPPPEWTPLPIGWFPFKTTAAPITLSGRERACFLTVKRQNGTRPISSLDQHFISLSLLWEKNTTPSSSWAHSTIITRKKNRKNHQSNKTITKKKYFFSLKK